MPEKEHFLRACIHYYGVLKFFKSMQASCLEGVRLFPSDARFRFYYSLSLLFEGRFQESIRELDSLQDKKDLSLGCFLALIYAHKKNNSPDIQVVQELESNLRQQRRVASDEGLFFAALVLLLTRKLDKAIEYADKLLMKSPNYSQGKMIRGWIDLVQRMESRSFNSSSETNNYFNEAVKEGDIESTLAKGMLYVYCGRGKKGFDLLTRLSSNNPSFLPGFIEVMKASLVMKDWESLLESSSKCLSLDRHCIEGMRHELLHSLVWTKTNDEKTEYLVSRLKDFSTGMELREPKNPLLYLQSARLFSSLSESNTEVLRATITLADRAAHIDAGYQILAWNEVARQNLSLGRVKDAQRHFLNANKINTKDVDSTVGLLYCSYLTNPDDKDFLNDLETLEQMINASLPESQSMILLYLLAMTGVRRGRSQDEITKYLETVVNLKIKILRDMNLSLDYYLELDPEMSNRVVQVFLDMFGPLEPMSPGQPLTNELKHATQLLDLVMNACPAHRQPLFLMSQIKFLSGNASAALSLLDKCLDLELKPFPEGHLFKAKILIHLNEFQAADSALDSALSLDFGIRNHIDFPLIKSSLLKHSKNYEEAIVILRTALNGLSERKRDVRQKKSLKELQLKINMTLELTSLYDLLDQSTESEKLLTDLESEFHGETSFEGRIRIARAVSARNKGNLDQSLSILRSIGDEVSSDYFITSRQMMADIYLKFRQERRLYAACFKEIADRTESKDSLLLLGAAYMNILEPEKAIEVYETCLKKNPKDPDLIRRVGQALVTAHFFDKAVTYYKASIKTSSASSDNNSLTLNLKHDLAALLLRLKRHQESRDFIKSSLEQIEDQEDGRSLEMNQLEVKFMFLLSKIQMNQEAKETVITTLKRAYSLQSKVFKRMSIEKPDSVDEDKNLLINIGSLLADLLASYSRNYSSAISLYKELLSVDSTNVKILSSLANLELMQNNFDSAQEYTSVILKFAPEDDDSLLMMTDMMFTRNDFEGAFDQLLQLLEKKVTHYKALLRLIEAGRKTGRMEKVSQVIDQISQTAPSCDSDSTFNFCRGLLYKITQDSMAALNCFYRARRDSELGQQALLHMIDIYLNPDYVIIGGSVLELPSIPSERLQKLESNLKSANKVLNDLFTRFGDSFEYRFFKSFLYVVRRQRNDIDQAVSGFNEAAREFPDNPCCLYGIATGLAVAGQTSKAKLTLKKLFRQEWEVMSPSALDNRSSLSTGLPAGISPVASSVDAFEKASLLMADIYLASNKSDPAKNYLEKAVMINKSCIKAYELMGHLREKENNYSEAVDSYHVAFTLGLRKNPVIGFKLAFNCMKSKLYSRAVEVGREVLSLHPDYPRIQEDIIDKSLMAYLRI